MSVFCGVFSGEEWLHPAPSGAPNSPIGEMGRLWDKMDEWCLARGLTVKYRKCLEGSS